MKHTKDAVVEVTPQVIPTSKTVSHFTGGYGEIRPYQDIAYYASMAEPDYARLKHITPIPLNNYTSPPKSSTGKIIKIETISSNIAERVIPYLIAELIVPPCNKAPEKLSASLLLPLNILRFLRRSIKKRICSPPNLLAE